MHDDDNQPSFEILDEANPERNKRSFFDWLRGKEETEEEKLRKKLDEELKFAARKRAEQFEEEQRQEEKREVAETRKLKKRWRKQLVERSKERLEKAAESNREPVDGYEIAELMVAERIVKLHDMIEHEDLRRSEIKALKIHLDFMGLLSEKLEKPELEVPEEVQKLYLAIAASVEDTTGEPTPAATPDNTSPTVPETAPMGEADTAYTVFAASIVTAIRRIMRPDASKPPSGGASPEVSPSPVSASPAQPSIPERLVAAVRHAAMPAEAIRHEIFQTVTARSIAGVAEKAEVMTARATRRTHPDVAAAAIAAAVVVAANRRKDGPAPERLRQAARKEKLSESFPEKDIEFWSDLELTSRAETVALGSGRYLAEAYRQGEIDREGLIKVLKKVKKGQDYRSEFQLQRTKWQRHMAESAEYLAQPSPPQTQSIPPPRTPETHPPEKILPPPTTATPRAPLALVAAPAVRPSETPEPTPTTSSPTVSDQVHSLKKTALHRDQVAKLRRQARTILLGTSVVLVLLLLAFVVALYGR